MAWFSLHPQSFTAITVQLTMMTVSPFEGRIKQLMTLVQGMQSSRQKIYLEASLHGFHQHVRVIILIGVAKSHFCVSALPCHIVPQSAA
jgi:hypothetical protein